jgi:hypothetical protein
MPNEKSIALFKLNENSFIPTELFQSRPTIELNPKNKYESFSFGEEAVNNYDQAFRKNLHYYFFFKKDLTLSPSKAKEKLKEWKTRINNRTASNLLTSVFGDQYLNPITFTELFIYKTIKSVLSNVKADNELNIQVVFSQPPYRGDIKTYYYDNFSTALNRVYNSLRSDVELKNFNLTFPEINNKKYFNYEQYAVFYYYSLILEKIKDDQSDKNYLIIDAGSSTTDLALIRKTASTGEFKKGAIPQYDTLEKGGNYIDTEILDFIKTHYQKNFSNDEEIRILRIIENVRKNRKNVYQDLLIEIENKSYFINSDKLKSIFSKYFEEIQDSLINLINKFKESGIDYILISGGFTQDLAFDDFLISKDFLNNAGIIKNDLEIYPSNMVSLGLAAELYSSGFDETDFITLERKASRIEAKFLAHDVVLDIHRKGALNGSGEIFDVSEIPSVNQNNVDIVRGKYSPASSSLNIREIDIYLKTDLDVEYDPKKLFKVKLKNPIPKKDIFYSNILYPATSEGEISFRYKPSFYIPDERPGKTFKRVYGEDNTSKKKYYSFNESSLTHQLKYDILIAIDFGMANSSVAIVADKKLLNENFIFIDDLKEKKSSHPIQPKPENGKPEETFIPDTSILAMKLLNSIDKSLSFLVKSVSEIQKDKITSELPEEKSIVEKKSLKDYYDSIINSEFQIDFDDQFNNLTLQSIFEKFKINLEKNHRFYSDKVIYSFLQSFYSSTDYLTILAGPPGVGKSALVKYYFKFLEDFIMLEEEKSLLTLISVSPNWHSPDNLLGFFNHLSDKPIRTPFTLQIALANNLYRRFGEKSPLVCAQLDEFNLAHPETYLSEIISKMESESPKICLKDKDYEHYWISVPPNFKIVATVNVDAASKSLSPKVLDRGIYIRIRPEYGFVEKLFEVKILDKNNKIFKALSDKKYDGQSIFKKSFDTASAGGGFISYRTVEKICNYINSVPSDFKFKVEKHIDIILSGYIVPKFPANNSLFNKAYADALNNFEVLLADFETTKTIVEKMNTNKLPGQLV